MFAFGVTCCLFFSLMLVRTKPDRVWAELCETDACRAVAQRLSEYMDTTVDPCDDFYQYACGNFLKRTELSNQGNKNVVEADIFIEMAGKVQRQLRNIIMEDPVKLPEPRPYQLVKQLFYLCTDQGSMLKRGIKPYKQLVDRAGGWPLLGDRWLNSNWSLQDMEVRLRQLGIGGNFLFDLSVVQDYKHSNRLILMLDQPKLGIDRELLVQGINNPGVQIYLNAMITLVGYFGVSVADVRPKLRKVMLFEMELAKITQPEANRNEHKLMNNLFTVAQVKERVSWVDWDTLFNGIIPHSVKLEDNKELIIVTEPAYFDRLNKLLNRYSKETVANYLIWRAVFKIFTSLTSEIRNPTEAFGEAYAKDVNDWGWHCVQEASSISLPLASLYVKKYFDNNTKQEAVDMIKRLQDELFKTIHQLSWMESKTKALAQDKVWKMESIVGYPEGLDNTDKLEMLYNGLRMNQENFLEAELDLVRWYNSQDLERLHRPHNRKDLRTYGPMSIAVDVLYNPQSNVVMLPAAMMQFPIFVTGLPKYINYARLGFILGHEMIHGFNNEGAQFDGDGNLNNWWDKTSQQHFQERMQCFINQYSNYQINTTYNVHVNGVATLGENVADIGGLKLAYNAYRSHLPTTEPRLPGLQEFSNAQLFVLSFANTWCTWMSKEQIEVRAATDKHSLPRYRVNGVLSDWPEFSRLFYCAANTPMNPKKKCSIW